MSAEDVLVLVNKLRSEARADADPPDIPDDTLPWAQPEEQVRAIMAQMSTPPPPDLSPKFLYVSRPSDEQLARAASEAYGAAHRLAERLALAAGRRLAGLASLSYGSEWTGRHGEKVMERQRCAALLAASSYTIREGEVVSDDPHAAEVTISVHAIFNVE